MRSDEATAAGIARRLEEGAGLSVWWDRRIVAGTDFSAEIERELAAAKVVVVLWSTESYNSKWVRDEAAYARDCNKLVPVRLDGAEPPLGFRQIQSLEFRRSKDDRSNPALDEIGHVVQHLAGATPLPPATNRQRQGPSSKPVHTFIRRRRMAVSIAVALGLGVLAVVLVRPLRHETPPISTPSVLVLPFRAMSEEPRMRHHADALSEEITIELAQQRELHVESRTAASAATTGNEVSETGRESNVSYVLEGSLRPIADRLRLTTQLVRARDQFRVWSETYDLSAAETEEDYASLRMASQMIDSEIRLDISLQQARRTTRSADAFRYFESAARLRHEGNTGGSRLPVPMQSVVDQLDKAIALDPDFALAHSLRANSYWNRLNGTLTLKEAAPEARRSIDRALALDPDNPDFLANLAYIQMQDELDLAAAEQTLERVRKLDPNTHRLINGLAWLAMQRGDLRNSLRYWSESVESMPQREGGHRHFGTVLMIAGDYAAAQEQFDTAIALTPRGGNVATQINRVMLQVRKGDDERARAEFGELWSRQGSTAALEFAPILGLLGQKEARKLLVEWAADPAVKPDSIFWGYYSLGSFGYASYDEALPWLRQAIDDRAYVVSLVRLPNAFPGLQDHPGYAEALKYLVSLHRSL